MGRQVSFENVPAWVCDECGDAYFDTETCRHKLDRLREAPPPVQRTVEVPVYAFS
ncbi:MAG: YgiT-type zinc finger protein [Bacillota bacterium]